MTQEEKFLLLQDICARLPYNFVYCYCNAPFANGEPIVLTPVVISNLMNAAEDLVIKPYLRLMSNMTKEERNKYHSYCYYYYGTYFDSTDSIDWLNAHHFDYRGLIELGLAIEVTKENNPYEN